MRSGRGPIRTSLTGGSARGLRRRLFVEDALEVDRRVIRLVGLPVGLPAELGGTEGAVLLGERGNRIQMLPLKPQPAPRRVRPPLRRGLIDRILVAAWRGGMEPLLAITKEDLAERADEDPADPTQQAPGQASGQPTEPVFLAAWVLSRMVRKPSVRPYSSWKRPGRKDGV